ncbi:MAG TPA: BamA/TamA family outer membrane protein [Saprospiraceae bacterium]|nr:BamA/TamA family outer membrane protein [Saprospiraceae bacterium]
MLKHFLFLIILCQFCPANSQLYTLHLSSPENKIITQWYHSQPPSQDSISWILARNNLFHTLHNEGFLLADLKEWKFEGDTIYAVIDPDRLIRWAKISFRGIEFLPPKWVQELDVSGQIVDYQAWKSNVSRILKNAQSEGYLFADYRLEIQGLQNDSLQAQILFNPGLKITLDTIEVEGTAKLSDQYLEKTIDLKRGQPVTPEALANLQQQINNLRFVQQTAPPVLILVDGKATIRVYLNNRNASSFDFLLGLQPSAIADKAITLNGYVKLDLINQLFHGERMYLNLEKLRPRSQKLDLSVSYPYLLDLPFGVEGEFNLLKNDTLYSEVQWKAGISIPFGRTQYIRAGITQHATNIISIDKNRIVSTKRLPEYVDLRIKGVTLGLFRNRLDFDLNPRKGYSVLLNATFSQKHVVPNSLIEDLGEIDPAFDYSTLYDSLRENSSRVSLEGNFRYFIPWGLRSTILLAVDAGALKGGSKLFVNELFRLGGYARLRGFDEESVLAQYFSIFTAEYRLIMGGGSYVSLFTDYAWIRNADVDIPYEDRPFGFGFGLNLETKAGIFGLRTAVGSQRGNPIDFGAARIHLGYTNRF